MPVKALAVNIELPQLFATETEGAATTTGEVIPEPGELVHPLAAVCVTVKVDAVNTVIDVVVAAVLHNRLPVKLLAVSTELPQLFTTETVGDDGTPLGAATGVAFKLVQPLTASV